MTLSWTGSTDNVGVTRHEITRGTTRIGEVGGTVTSYVDQAVAPNTPYRYTVRSRTSLVAIRAEALLESPRSGG